MSMILRSIPQQLCFAAAASTLFGLAFTVPVKADVVFVGLGTGSFYFQNSGSPPTTANNYAFSVFAAEGNLSDFTSASLVYPGPGSPQALGLDTNLQRFEGGGNFFTLADLHSSFPIGNYTINLSNSATMTSRQGSQSYAGDYYTADIPALTAASYSALQGMNPAQPLTVNFNSFVPNPNALDIVNSRFLVGSFGIIGPNTLTSATIPTGTLLPNTQYDFFLDFFQEHLGFDSINSVPIMQRFQVATNGSFTTGPAVAVVSEPASLKLLLVGLLGLAALRTRRNLRLFPVRHRLGAVSAGVFLHLVFLRLRRAAVKARICRHYENASLRFDKVISGEIENRCQPLQNFK